MDLLEAVARTGREARLFPKLIPMALGQGQVTPPTQQDKPSRERYIPQGELCWRGAGGLGLEFDYLAGEERERVGPVEISRDSVPGSRGLGVWQMHWFPGLHKVSLNRRLGTHWFCWDPLLPEETPEASGIQPCLSVVNRALQTPDIPTLTPKTCLLN